MPESVINMEWVERAMEANARQIEKGADPRHIQPYRNILLQQAQREQMILSNLKRLMAISKNEDLGFIIQTLYLAKDFVDKVISDGPAHIGLKEHDVVEALKELGKKGVLS